MAKISRFSFVITTINRIIFTSFFVFVSEQFMKALASGEEGFAFLGEVLTLLLQTLLQDAIAEVLELLYLIKMNDVLYLLS